MIRNGKERRPRERKIERSVFSVFTYLFLFLGTVFLCFAFGLDFGWLPYVCFGLVAILDCG